jgi:integrase
MSKNADNRRAPGEGTLRQRKDRNKWEAAVVIGYQANGHPKRLRKLFDTKTDARVWLQDNVVAKRNGELNAASDTTFEAFLKDWLEVKKAARAERTVESYRYVCEKYLLPHLGKHKLVDLTPMHVQRLVTKLQQATTPLLVNRAHHYLKMILAEAVRLEVIIKNVAKSVKVPKPRRRELTRWTTDEAAKVLEHVHSTEHPLANYIHLALTTGMRREELFGLRWIDVNFDRAELKVQQCVTFINGRAIFGKPKTEDSQRTIYLDQGSIAVLRKQLEAVSLMRDVNASKWQENDLVFPSKVGTPFQEGRLSDLFRKLCTDLQVTRIRPYDLRSTWASVALEAGVSVKVVSERLGHRDANFTLQVYVRTVESQHRKAAMDTKTLYGTKPNPEASANVNPKKTKPEKVVKPRGRKKPSATSLPPKAKKPKK